VTNRILSLHSDSLSVRLFRIRNEDSQTKMLSLDDFDLEDSTDTYEGFDELRLRIIAVDCVEKTPMCWCSDDAAILNISVVHSSPFLSLGAVALSEARLRHDRVFEEL
jgi:hypothetical protein